MYLTKADYTEKTVENPRMLKPGGSVGPGTYTRARHNAPTSPGLLRRMEETAKVMTANCSLNDACLPSSLGSGAIGQPVPGQPGKTYVECTDEERARRLQNARQCAINNLATKGGIYGSA